MQSAGSAVQHPLVILATGGNKGIGKETVRQLAAAGHTVYLASRDFARGEAAAREIGGDVRAVALDVTVLDTLAAAAERLAREVGHLDVLVNNAGIAADLAPPSQVELATLRQTLEVNLVGPVAVTQALLPLLRQGGAKNIVNLSSELGSLAMHGFPDFAYNEVLAFAYNASKTALNAFTVLLAKELKPEGFRVNSVNPGFTATDMNDHHGHRTVEQAAAVVVQYATLAPGGPTGGFFTEGGTIPW